MIKVKSFDVVDLVIIAIAFIILFAYIISYFKGMQPDQNLIDWFLMAAVGLGLKKLPSTIGDQKEKASE